MKTLGTDGRVVPGLVMTAALIVLTYAPQTWSNPPALTAPSIEPYAAPRVLATEGFQDFLAEVAPNVYVGGQPSREGLTRMQGEGVVRVVNLRTKAEMDNRAAVPFDEAQTLRDLGIEYVHIPQGGPDTPYSPDALNRVAYALEGADGKVLLHCTVAWRASHMWAAYLVKHHGMSVADAMAVGRQMNMGGFPFADLLDRQIELKEPGHE